MALTLHRFFKSPTRLLLLMVGSFLCFNSDIYAQDQSFESTVPSHWSTTNGSLSISNDHYKHGTRSLRWDWSAHAEITVSNLQNHGLAPSQVTNFNFNMFRMWVYNTAKTSQTPLIIEFYDQQGNLQFHYDFGLNFTGWRAASASYLNEMSGIKNSTNLTTMKIKAPNLGEGVLFFDFIDYTMARNTMRSADYQLPFIRLNNDEHWGDMLYFQSLPKLPVTPPTAQELAAIAIIKQHYDDFILGQSPSGSAINNAVNRYHALNISYINGISKGNPLYGQDYPNSQNIKAVEDFIYTFAKDYKHNGRVSSRDYFLNTIRYILDQGFADGSAMETLHHIGYSFRNIPSAVHLMKSELETVDLWTDAQKMVEWYTAVDGIWEPTASNSNMDDANTRAIYRLGASLYKTTDAEKVQYLKGYKSYLENFLTSRAREGQGLKVDYTGFHHNTFYPGYSFLAYNGISQAVNFVSGGAFAISNPKRELFKNTLLLARVTMASGEIPNSLSGRNPFQNAPIRNGLKNLGLSTPVDTDVLRAHNLMYGADSQTSAYGVETAPQGFWQVNFANLGVYRQADWVADVKGFNKYFWGSEIYAQNNRFGRYQSYGAIEVMYPGGHSSSGFNINGWDWRKTPGATTKFLSWEDLEAARSRQDEVTDSNFAASLRFGAKQEYYIDQKIEGNYGVFGMDFSQKKVSPSHDTAFKFKKSVFFFDGKLICLGSDIHSANGLIATNLFQNYLSSTAMPIVANNTAITGFPYHDTLNSGSDHWIIDAVSTGYFVKNGNTIAIDRQYQDSPSQSGNGTMTNGNFASAYINHDVAPVNAGYEYVIIPGTTSAEMEAFTTTMNAPETAFYEVIQKDEHAHIVKYNNMYGYALFGDGNYGTQTPIKDNYGACLVMTEEVGNTLNLTVVSPDLNFASANGTSQMTSIDLTLNGEWRLDSSSGGRVNIMENSGETIVVVGAKDGLPVDIKLVRGFVNADYPIIYYEDFASEMGRGFSRMITNTGDHTDASNIFKRVNDVPDPEDTHQLFDPTIDRPERTIPRGATSNQRALSTVGNDASRNFPLDAYAVFTTLDLTVDNPRISAEDRYKYASFWTERRYGNGDIATVSILGSTSYTGDPATTTWTNLPLVSGKLATTSDGLHYVKGVVDLTDFANSPNGATVTLALRYQGSSSAYSSSNRNGTFYFSDLQFFVQSSPLSVVSALINNSDIQVYPNPVSTILHMVISSSLQIEKITLVDISGKTMYYDRDIRSIDLSRFSPGLYFLSFESKEGHVLTKKVMVK